MGIKHCYSKGSNNRCLECTQGYGLSGDCNYRGCDTCVKCGKNCLSCHMNICYECKCGYTIDRVNYFSCTKAKPLSRSVNYGNRNGAYSTNSMNNELYQELSCDSRFINLNIILIIILILALKLH